MQIKSVSTVGYSPGNTHQFDAQAIDIVRFDDGKVLVRANGMYGLYPNESSYRIRFEDGKDPGDDEEVSIVEYQESWNEETYPKKEAQINVF